MTDDYDSFEQARVPVERLYELGAEINAEITDVRLDSDRAAALRAASVAERQAWGGRDRLPAGPRL